LEESHLLVVEYAGVNEVRETEQCTYSLAFIPQPSACEIGSAVKSRKGIEEVLIKFQAVGENGITIIFMVCIPHQVLLGCSYQGE
jgi:hypothetical protein